LSYDRSIVFGDFNNDDKRDVAFTTYTKLHRNDTVPTFTDITASSTLANANPEGAGWLDYDGDGWLDFVHPDGSSGSANLWQNNGDETFSDQTGAAGLPTSGLGNGEWVLGFKMFLIRWMSTAMKCIDFPMTINRYSGAVHPGFNFGNCCPIWVEHIRQHVCIENKITLNQ
ncbi:MAG: hypothetical protein GQ542_17115, partial [Desulforhopalus sp.]|nr:hypothetical protein [Desulforhopalus sp.]